MPNKCLPFLFVSTKAYGDFLIAYKSILESDPLYYCSDLGPRILAGNHIKPLANSLGVPENFIAYFGSNDLHDVPAAYDIRRHGITSASKSIIELRKSISPYRKNYRLVFDRNGWREFFITIPNKSYALPKGSKNIYLAYDHFLSYSKSLNDYGTSKNSKTSPVAVIVPGSRIKRKVIPGTVLFDIYKYLSLRSISSVVLILEGENIDIPCEINVVCVKKDFSSLIESINRHDIVVSADSLSAHLAEFLNKKTFVVSPVNNFYWLPKNAYLSRASATFEDLSRFPDWLDSV